MKIFLIGFMAAGKSSLGARLATEFGLDFVDLDREIERTVKRTIQEIFSDHGESHFRTLEQTQLKKIIAKDNLVVALGGGTVTTKEDVDDLKREGWVVFIDAAFETCFSRIVECDERPLGTKSQSDLHALYKARIDGYRACHLSFVPHHIDLHEDAQLLSQQLKSLARLVPNNADSLCVVTAGSKTTPVLVKPGLLQDVGKIIRASFHKRNKILLICDSNVFPLIGIQVLSQLEKQNFQTHSIVFPAGETSKCLLQYESMIEEALSMRVDRHTVVVNCGGGVTGDLGGFVAATLLRGLDHIQIPTSLLAMVDSSIGGKVGINTKAGKNLLGAFWHPSLVLSDPQLLDSLPDRELKCGFGEVLKTVLLKGRREFENFRHFAQSQNFSDIQYSQLIFECMNFKASVVSKDSRENGLRKILNLGHTVGHAIEKALSYQGMSHGEAVGLGCLAACRVSEKMGLAEESLEKEVRETLKYLSMDVDLKPWLNKETLRHMVYDKKSKDGKIDFVAIEKPGKTKMVKMTVEELQRILCVG